jgi:prepilin-type N-terminal cleavage/methylation domain-containing protein
MRGNCTYDRRGFTLIELSIVLVIIGLIVGGILVGQNLINAAAVRAQVTQIEKYNTAANTFREKYGYLPGDMPATPAAQFGFAARGTYAGQGDGNGVIEGVEGGGPGENYGYIEANGETATFWVDLSTARLIDGGFTLGSETCCIDIVASSISKYFPAAKIGNGNYVYVWSGGPSQTAGQHTSNGINYFGVSPITASLASYGCGYTIGSTSGPGLTVVQAYAMDTKVDDGMPQTGRVIATYVNALAACPVAWAAGGETVGAAGTGATAGSSTTCYDNSATSNGTPGVSGATQHYSIEMSNGSNVACALSFQLQAGD